MLRKLLAVVRLRIRADVAKGAQPEDVLRADALHRVTVIVVLQCQRIIARLHAVRHRLRPLKRDVAVTNGW